MTSLPDSMTSDDARLAIMAEVEVETTEKCKSRSGELLLLRQKTLYDAVGVVFVEDTAEVDKATLENAFKKVTAAEMLSPQSRTELERKTVEHIK